MQGRKILLVDDEKDFVQTLAERLQLRGMDVELAYDGPSALECLSRILPDVVVLDLSMPGMTGDAVLHSIKSRHPRMPVIVLTGHCMGGETTDEDTQCPPLSGAFACLTKPLALSVLLQTLQAAVEASTTVQ